MRNKLLELGRDSFSENEIKRRKALSQLVFLGLSSLLLLILIASTSIKGIKRGLLASRSFAESKNRDFDLSIYCYEKAAGISHCYKTGVKN